MPNSGDACKIAKTTLYDASKGVLERLVTCTTPKITAHEAPCRQPRTAQDGKTCAGRGGQPYKGCAGIKNCALKIDYATLLHKLREFASSSMSRAEASSTRPRLSRRVPRDGAEAGLDAFAHEPEDPMRS